MYKAIFIQDQENLPKLGVLIFRRRLPEKRVGKGTERIRFDNEKLQKGFGPHRILFMFLFYGTPYLFYF